MYDILKYYVTKGRMGCKECIFALAVYEAYRNWPITFL